MGWAVLNIRATGITLSVASSFWLGVPPSNKDRSERNSQHGYGRSSRMRGHIKGLTTLLYGRLQQLGISMQDDYADFLLFVWLAVGGRPCANFLPSTVVGFQTRACYSFVGGPPAYDSESMEPYLPPSRSEGEYMGSKFMGIFGYILKMGLYVWSNILSTGSPCLFGRA